jgi:ABC-2 type transport system ATP-binding protein
LVGLDDSRHTLVRRMSGGQQQRLSLALALIGKPSLVFLDEPTAGMDPHARATTWTMIRELRDRGTTVVLTTHAMDEAEQLCDRVGIIDHGRLVACDTPKELTTHAASDETTFTTVTGLAVDDLTTRLGLVPGAVRELRPGDYLVDAPATPELLAAIATWLAERGALLSELRAGRRSLEDVFLRLTGEGRS